MQRVLLLGFGAIAGTLVKAVRGDGTLQVSAVLARARHHERIRAALGGSVQLIEEMDQLDEPVDCVVECAGHSAVKEHVPAALERGIDVILVSVGSLSEPGLVEALEASARKGGTQITLVPGAVAGIEAIAAARPFGLEKVLYTGRKPPVGWLDTPAEKICDLRNLKTATVLFEGNARDAARLYPKNANVAATAALAGVGLDRTGVRLIADPAVVRNVHTVRAEGTFGELDVTIAGKPLPENPKTSALAAYSAVRALRSRVDPLVT